MPTEFHTNRLINEVSPYLLQHADNPVDWYPWGSEAFKKAREENKPVFLSIGYSTCHWCHVMAHESFEDHSVAKLMNEVFVSIKVDREERPDIDAIYMTVCQMMTGSGGWPLTIVMTPDKRPFFAATYIPRVSRFGLIGMLEMIPHIRELWIKRHSDVVRSADEITMALQQVSLDAPGEKLDKYTLNLAYEQLEKRFDEQHGGFVGTPKFPIAHNLSFLLRYWKRTGKKNALQMVEKTLQAMRAGGIYDHIGFGFHRYATDSQWLVPHFEKMLYDQAMIAIVYTEAYQVTGKKEYEKTTRGIFDYVLYHMTAPEGAFYSAEDADSEGQEGKFYLWTQKEIQQILNDKEADLAIEVFDIKKEGNFSEEGGGKENGTNILHLKKSSEELSSELGLSEQELQSQLEAIRQKLFTYREKRVHPGKDDKILTDWNGLMIAALAKGAQVFNEPSYAEAARRAADFINTRICTASGRLLHRYRNGEASILSYADDYAFLIWGLLELYEATFDVRYLETSLALNRDFIGHFWDMDNGGFYSTPDDGEELLIRQKEVYDTAIPSGNSVAMSNLLRLSRMTADYELEEKAARIGSAFSKSIKKSPSAHTQLMSAVDFALGPSYEIVITGNSQAQDTKKMLNALGRHFVPNKVVLFIPSGQESSKINRLAEFTKDMPGIDGKATAYVCSDYKCKLPVTHTSKMLGLLIDNKISEE